MHQPKWRGNDNHLNTINFFSLFNTIFFLLLSRNEYVVPIVPRTDRTQFRISQAFSSPLSFSPMYPKNSSGFNKRINLTIRCVRRIKVRETALESRLIYLRFRTPSTVRRMNRVLIHPRNSKKNHPHSPRISVICLNAPQLIITGPEMTSPLHVRD